MRAKIAANSQNRTRRQPDEADAAVHDLPVKPELAAIDEAEAEHHGETRPDRPELDEAPDNDLAGAQELHQSRS